MKEKNKNKIKLKKYLQLHFLVKSNLWMLFFKRIKANTYVSFIHFGIWKPTSMNFTIFHEAPSSLNFTNEETH
jgi:hypothetical protein